MKKKEFIESVSEYSGMTKTDTSYLFDVFENVMTNALSQGEELPLFGLGKLVPEFKAERNGVNPQTGEKIIIKAHNVVKFKPSTSLKKDLK